jgi:endonuclease/exonuclease/phosphatase (EEP) superfamily protein YafD
MPALHALCQLLLGLLALVLICVTLLPLLRSDAWWIRILDFPRIQFAVLIVLTLMGYIALRSWQGLRPWQYALAAGAGIALLWQLTAIAPYTAMYPKEMPASTAGDVTNRISLLIYNVLADNRQAQALLDLISDTDPDLILLSEPNQWWLEHLTSLKDDYPYTLLQPQENTYGMLLYSRLELVAPEIRFLIEQDVPSFRSDVRLRSGTLVTLYGIHPRPPGLPRDEDDNITQVKKSEQQQGEREDSDKRDAELMLVAKEVKKLGDVPVIVAGDFNDVAWSHTTHLFQRVGGMLDPRVGRGLYNTYDTRSRILRYPLDHAFASRHFGLAELRRLPDVGSDHLPFLVVFDYDPNAVKPEDKPKADAEDEQEASEAIKKGKAR